MKPPKNTSPSRHPSQPTLQSARRLSPPGVVQRKTVAPWIREAPAPPQRYSPQPVPKALQTKKAPGPTIPASPAGAKVARGLVQPKAAGNRRISSRPTAAPKRGGECVQRAIRGPFDMPDMFADLRGSLLAPVPLPTPVLPPPIPVASSLPPSLPMPVPSVPHSPKPEEKKPLERKKRNKGTVYSLGAFLGEKDDTEKFAGLQTLGELDASSITFSQFRCGASFQHSFVLDGQPMSSVSDLAGKLTEKPQLYTSTPRIRITLYKKRIMSVDNRRLKAHQMAGAKILYTKVLPHQLTANDRSKIDGEAPAENLHVT